jgi:hypothetical protein
MQGSDILCTLSLPLPLDWFDHPRAVPADADENGPVSSWTLHTPPLRYQVASMEHWLDLNA